MGEAATQILEDLNMKKRDSNAHHNDERCESMSLESSIGVATKDDAPSVTSPPSSKGPLHDLSHLMAHLPIRRGLSKYYEGKSQSFYDIRSVRSIEEIEKKVVNPKAKMKSSSKTYTMGFHGHNDIKEGLTTSFYVYSSI